MLKDSKGKCEAASHKLLKEKAKTRVQELQGMVTNIQNARKEGRTADIAIWEDQMHQMLGGWGAELNDPSPASSLHGGSHGSLGSFSEELARLLKQHCDEKDDAESPLKELPQPKLEGPEPNLQNPHSINFTEFTEDFFVSSKEPQEDIFQGLDLDQCHTASNFPNTVVDIPDLTTQMNDNHFEFPDYLNEGPFISHNDIKQSEEDVVPNVMPDICPPVSAFLGPKCALWDCSRPAQVLCQDYCSSGHALLARNEGLPGNTPVLRPGGIALKDGSLFAALNAKTQGKDVGIPNCDGAATLRSPWKDSELFHLSLLEGETLREWLFFGRPRRAFESGNRKQRSLPDYSGRGWHESRKQVMKEYGGQKRSYYMDPQPSSDHEWHLFEYEVNNSDACALYRLELKFGTAKKSSKGKLSSDPLADLQKKMGRLTAEASTEVGNNSKGKAGKKADAGNIFGSDNQTTPTT
ncbi:transcription factor VOZ1 [Pyrus x bretschneideri]|uniref:transcription factor VOZ1 n=1 Tax=Pyrus x bretschneideri TaxID=225117 RepID=UPI00202E1A74|nr:transcription factor VOZ1 [Pyrus x bretschneideri]XP_048439925.1 transcription factor VOZ1 [Pyrus x bretschneideri]